MDEQHWQKLMKRMDLADKIADALLYGGEDEDDDDDDDADAVNEALDIASLDRIARERGEKPADEWTRSDFKYLVHNHSQLKNLELGELRALFLVPMRTVGGVLYCRRSDVREARRRRRNGEKPFYDLDISPAATWAAGHAYPGARQWLEDEKRKLDEIWEKL